jgi:hypothetical protein
MRQDRAPRSLQPQATVTTSRGDKHVICFRESILKTQFELNEYPGGTKIATCGKKGFEVVWGVLFTGDAKMLTRVRRLMMRDGIMHTVVSDSKSNDFKKVWRQHSCLHPFLRELKVLHEAQSSVA